MIDDDAEKISTSFFTFHMRPMRFGPYGKISDVQLYIRELAGKISGRYHRGPLTWDFLSPLSNSLSAI